MNPAVVARYRALAASPDRRQRALGRAQLARLERVSARPAGEAAPSRWAHVPVAALFEEAGNTLAPRSSGQIETGHEPLHRSSSGRCVVIDPDRGLWWCRSCYRGGDAVTLVMQLHGWSYGRATAWLAGRFAAGLTAPAPPRSRRAPRPPLAVEVHQ